MLKNIVLKEKTTRLKQDKAHPSNDLKIFLALSPVTIPKMKILLFFNPSTLYATYRYTIPENGNKRKP